MELGYFGDTFGRPFAKRLPWLAEDAEPNADMWASTLESRVEIIELYRRAWAHTDATITTLALDSIGRVPWWPAGRRDVSLHQVLVHVIAETHRHAGHAEIIRELIDGATGLRQDNPNRAPVTQAWWHDYHDRVEHAAQKASHVQPATHRNNIKNHTNARSATKRILRPVTRPARLCGGLPSL